MIDPRTESQRQKRDQQTLFYHLLVYCQISNNHVIHLCKPKNLEFEISNFEQNQLEAVDSLFHCGRECDSAQLLLLLNLTFAKSEYTSSE